jgi:isoleucyl-tRNA synthetase
MLGNLYEFDAVKLTPYNQLPLADLYILNQLNQIIRLSRESYANYDYKSVVNACSTFMTNELSAYYMDFTKDILYIEKKDSARRLAVQTVLYTALDALTRILAPVLVHTTEEVWDHFAKSKTSVHLEEFPEAMDLPTVNVFDWDRLFALRSEIFKSLENARNQKLIGKSLEAEVSLVSDPETMKLLQSYVPNPAQWLIVSKINVLPGKETAITITKAQGTTCPRCWNVVEHIHEDGLCDRCHGVVND